MKKRFSALTLVLVGFLMMAVGVGATAGYIEWAGSPDFRQTQENLSNIQTGITTLQGNLEAVENELASTKTKLEDTEADLEDAEANSNTKQDEIDKLKVQVSELNSEVSELETEKANTIALIKKEITEGIRAVNEENGPRHKYNAVKDIVNEWADKLGLETTERLGDHGTSTEYDDKVKELEQAEKDMESLKNQSEEVLESLSPSVETTGDNN